MDTCGLVLIDRVEGFRKLFDGYDMPTVGFGGAAQPRICRCGCEVFTKLGNYLICNECGVDLW